MLNLNDVIDLDRYPLDRLESEEGRSWLASIRQRLADDGSCTLPQFARESALATLIEQAESVAHLAYPGPTEVSPYFFNYALGQGQAYPADHPLYRKGKRNLAQVAGDLIPAEYLLTQIHQHPLIAEFLGALLGHPVYVNTDPYQGLNISVMNEGGCQQWHFDGSKLVTTLLLQAPESGGRFEYCPNIRSEQNENFDRVKTVLDGDTGPIKSLELKAGTLSLFQGHYSMHRVSEVVGNRQRLQGILGYSAVPDYRGKYDSSLLHYGPRVAEIEAQNPVYD